jgi:DNA-binding transcriptional regulator YhcF (GntR family)
VGAIDGWIKLHRKLLNSSIFQNPNLLKFWIWCLLKATHCDRKTRVGLQEIELKEGQFIFGRNKAGVELGMNPSTVYKYLGVVEKDGLVCTNRNNKFTVVTIVNWSLYQTEEHKKEQQSNSKVTTKEQQSNTNKNVKNDKNDKEDIITPLPPLLKDAIKDFMAMRKQAKKPMTDRAVELMLNKLEKLSGGNTKTKIAILEQSIVNGWTGVYPLKEEKIKEAANPFDELLRKELENEQSRNYSSYEDSERLLPDVLPRE